MRIAGKTAAFVAALSCAGALAIAQSPDEIERDAVGAIGQPFSRPEMRSPANAEAVMRMRDGKARGWTRQGDRIPAAPLGNTVLQHDATRSFSDKISLRLNNQKDRVIGEFTNCDIDQGPRRDAQRGCDTVEFVFPQLEVDMPNRTIVMGEEVVGYLGGVNSVQLTNGYQLRLDKVNRLLRRDTGGDYMDSVEVRVGLYLEKS